MERTVPVRVGLLGWPVGHSRSPAMHNAAFRELELEWEYLLLPVHPEHIGEAVGGLRGLGFAGANVTVPHKQTVMEALDEVTMEARIIGAVNTIVHHEGRLIGYNTDALGFLRALREEGVEPRGKEAVLLGAGGAARAILYTLLAARARVTVVNRDLAKARQLATELGTLAGIQVPALSPTQQRPLQASLERADLLINATSVGMHPNPTATPIPDGVTLPPTLIVYDLVYNPRETRLLRQARAAGARGIDGLGMLVHQGAAAFTLWTGQPAPVAVMRAAADG